MFWNSFDATNGESSVGATNRLLLPWNIRVERALRLVLRLHCRVLHIRLRPAWSAEYCQYLDFAASVPFLAV